MTPVDLNRLREARAVDPEVGADWEVLFAAVEAVLDAPTEWRCAVSGADTVQPACGHDGTDLDQTDDSGHWECRECGWRGIIDD